MDIVTYFLLRKIMKGGGTVSIRGLVAIDPYQIGYLGHDSISVLEAKTNG